MAIRDEMISWNLNYDDLEIDIGCCTACFTLCATLCEHTKMLLTLNVLMEVLKLYSIA